MDKRTSAVMVLAMAKEHGIVTDGDMREQGIHPQIVKRLVDSGKLVRMSRGCYRLPDSDYELTAHHDLVAASAIVPKGVICLLSALQFHEIGTQQPRQVWIALKRGSWIPKATYPPMRFVHMSENTYAAGIEVHTLEGQSVSIYDLAKTVVDCFKFRNTIGMDVALEALNESWRERKVDLNRVAAYAHTCRVWNVMRPYLEAVTA